MKIDTIYLDLDDTLNTLSLFIARWAGVEAHEYRQWWTDQYGLVTALKQVGAVGPLVTDDEFWKSIPQSVWANCPVSSEFEELIDFSFRTVGQENVFIATLPTEYPSCHAGKAQWLRRVLPAPLNDQYVLCRPGKQMLSRPGAVLIDDNPNNVEAWNARGGQGILVPRPWNREKYCPVDQLAALLAA